MLFEIYEFWRTQADLQHSMASRALCTSCSAPAAGGVGGELSAAVARGVGAGVSATVAAGVAASVGGGV